jgi:MFS family permease
MPEERNVPPPPGSRPLALEGAFHTLAQGLGEVYLGAYALFLGAGGLTLGLVATLPTASTAAAQVLAGRALRRVGEARALLRHAWTLQAAAYAALGTCAFLAPEAALAALCAIAALAWGAGGLAVPAWSAMVSRVVPRRRHGWFFGLRGSAQQAGMVVAIVGGGALLAGLSAAGGEAGAFATLFLLAGMSRMAGPILLRRVPAGLDQRRIPAGDAAAPARPRRPSRKVRRLAAYLWMLHFATHISTPFFVPYMLRELRMSYGLVGLLIAAPALTKVLTLRFWGRLADRVGPGPILRTAGWLVAVVPGLWLLSPDPWWILAAQVYSGLVWGAFELAQASSILQATRGREREVALFYAVDGPVLIAGSLLGGLVVNLTAPRFGSGYLAAMGLSTVLRLLPAVALLWRVQGIGRPDWSHLMMPLRILGFRPTRGATFQPLGTLTAPSRRRAAPHRRAPARHPVPAPDLEPGIARAVDPPAPQDNPPATGPRNAPLE